MSYEQAIYSYTTVRNNIINEALEEHINYMQYLGVKVFDPLFEHFNGKIQINSVFRCLALDIAVGGSETSQYMRGQAMDLDALPPYDNKDLFKFVVDDLDFDQIVWEFGTNECPKWVHI